MKWPRGVALNHGDALRILQLLALKYMSQPRGLAHPTYREGLRDIWLDEDLFKN